MVLGSKEEFVVSDLGPDEAQNRDAERSPVLRLLQGPE